MSPMGRRDTMAASGNLRVHAIVGGFLRCVSQIWTNRRLGLLRCPIQLSTRSFVVLAARIPSHPRPSNRYMADRPVASKSDV
jgi:hypothetical protein